MLCFDKLCIPMLLQAIWEHHWSKRGEEGDQAFDIMTGLRYQLYTKNNQSTKKEKKGSIFFVIKKYINGGGA